MDDSDFTRPKKQDSIDLNGVTLSFDDIERVVTRFYTQVAQDEVLKVPFSSVRDWPVHIERLTHFWWMRLGGARYLPVSYNPVEKHFEAGFNQPFLQRWLSLFKSTLDAELKLEQAATWLFIAQSMGKALSFKNEMYKQHRAETKS